jgi:hypothetical protein
MLPKRRPGESTGSSDDGGYTRLWSLFLQQQVRADTYCRGAHLPFSITETTHYPVSGYEYWKVHTFLW